VTTFEKVTDFTHTKGRREEIDTTLDIGIAGECLAECTSKVRYCFLEYAKQAIFCYLFSYENSVEKLYRYVSVSFG
jgi:hypothetical protein